MIRYHTKYILAIHIFVQSCCPIFLILNSPFTLLRTQNALLNKFINFFDPPPISYTPPSNSMFFFFLYLLGEPLFDSHLHVSNHLKKLWSTLPIQVFLLPPLSLMSSFLIRFITLTTIDLLSGSPLYFSLSSSASMMQNQINLVKLQNTSKLRVCC